MAKTLREKYIEALTLEGYKRVKETHKFVVFQRTGDSNWYIGRAGSLRIGRTISGSIPASDKCKSFLLSRVSPNQSNAVSLQHNSPVGYALNKFIQED